MIFVMIYLCKYVTQFKTSAYQEIFPVNGFDFTVMWNIKQENTNILQKVETE